MNLSSVHKQGAGASVIKSPVNDDEGQMWKREGMLGGVVRGEVSGSRRGNRRECYNGMD